MNTRKGDIVSSRVYYTESLTFYLFSCRRLDKHVILDTFSNQNCTLKDRRRNGVVNSPLRERTVDGLLATRTISSQGSATMTIAAKTVTQNHAYND